MMTDRERIPEPEPRRMVDLPRSERKGGEVLNPAIAEPSQPGRLDVPATPEPAPSDSPASPGETDQKQ